VGLELRCVGNNDRHTHCPSLREITIVVVALDYHDPLALRNEPLYNRDSDRPETDDDYVIEHSGDLPSTQGALDAPAHQDVGEQGKCGRDKRYSERNKDNCEYSHERTLPGE
jgi:hypothetical protein